ncbi:hypothetical protein GXM_07338 [Nostoc sphaeroides CCNUC1]|uniref:Uncharacterized protein n=1 Tax=Nostoc sphaeroides CCNUC1 TaxID=2653204 RepID=A0A5P8WB60_9NOSO|nr:hypothetical protein GXM_07338 [Nostoc sphaeroides CCNUC1]
MVHNFDDKRVFYLLPTSVVGRKFDFLGSRRFFFRSWRS